MHFRISRKPADLVNYYSLIIFRLKNPAGFIGTSFCEPHYRKKVYTAASQKRSSSLCIVDPARCRTIIDMNVDTHSPLQTRAAPLLEMEGIDKSFPGVQALDNVSLTLEEGEVLALVGENGAGKSTLIKILSGAHPADKGEIRVKGAPLEITSPLSAAKAGIGVIYQEFNLVPSLSARENIFLGREKTRFGLVDHKEERREAASLFEHIGVSIDPDTVLGGLSIASQQVIEIAKALLLKNRIIVMDEPSATLTDTEVRKLFGIIRELKAKGLGIVYISHRLEEVFEIADRVTVLRDGKHVGTHRVSEVSRHDMIAMMVGRSLENEFPSRDASIGGERLAVSGLSWKNRVRNISFTVRSGEVLALTGLVGAGRTETARLLFGAETPDSGAIILNGTPITVRSPRHAIQQGICLLTEDRKSQGLVLELSAQHNFSLPNLHHFSSFGLVQRKKERSRFRHFSESLRIKLPGPDTPVKNLSGGNQQKIVLAKWLEANCDVVIFDEPTRGIDVGSKYEIYLLINRLAQRGTSIIMISSELPEVLGMADRIIVMHEGKKRGEIEDVRNATQEQILKMAIG